MCTEMIFMSLLLQEQCLLYLCYLLGLKFHRFVLKLTLLRLHSVYSYRNIPFQAIAEEHLDIKAAANFVKCRIATSNGVTMYS